MGPDSNSDGEDCREKGGIGGERLWWGVRGNRFQLQIIDPGRPVDFVIKFHGRQADHLNPEKPGVLCNYKLVARIRQPPRNMQKKLVRSLSNGNEFVAYVDAIGHLDGTRRLLEWKTTSVRYHEQPEGPTSLDLQLVFYSWISGISGVAIVAFVRKRVSEIQYLLTSITD